MRHMRPTRNRTEDAIAWSRAMRQPWGLRLEAYMHQASSPELLGRWVSSIWRATEGARELHEKHVDAAEAVLVWRDRLKMGPLATDAQIAAVKAANAYASSAEAWAKGRAA